MSEEYPRHEGRAGTAVSTILAFAAVLSVGVFYSAIATANTISQTVVDCGGGCPRVGGGRISLNNLGLSGELPVIILPESLNGFDTEIDNDSNPLPLDTPPSVDGQLCISYTWGGAQGIILSFNVQSASQVATGASTPLSLEIRGGNGANNPGDTNCTSPRSSEPQVSASATRTDPPGNEPNVTLSATASDPDPYDQGAGRLSFRWFRGGTLGGIGSGQVQGTGESIALTLADGTYSDFYVEVTDSVPDVFQDVPGPNTVRSQVSPFTVGAGGPGLGALNVTARLTTDPIPPVLPDETTQLRFDSTVTLGEVSDPPGLEYSWNVLFSDSSNPATGTVIGETSSIQRAFARGSYTVRLVVRLSVDGLILEGQSAVLNFSVGAASLPPRELGSLDGLTSNQSSMASLIDVTCPELQEQEAELSERQQDLLDRCSALKNQETSDSDAVAGVIAMDGQEMSAMSDQARHFSSVQVSSISARLLALRQGARGVSLAGITLYDHSGRPIPAQILASALKDLVGGGSGDAESSSPLSDSPLGIFANVRYRFGDKDETANSAAFDFDSKGLTVGADYRFTDRVVIGLAASYGSSEADMDSAGKTESDDLGFSVYGSTYGNNHYLDFLVGYGQLDFDSRRNISYSELGAGSIEAQEINAVASGSTDATQLWAGLSAGYDFRKRGWTFGPDVAVTYIETDIDGFDEQIDGDSRGFGLALAYGDQTVKSFTAEGGLHLSYAWSTKVGVIVPQIRGAYVKEFETDADTIIVNFVETPFVGSPGQPGPNAVIVLDKPDSSYIRWGANISGQFVGGFSGFISYDTYSALRSITSHEFTAGLRFQRAFR